MRRTRSDSPVLHDLDVRLDAVDIVENLQQRPFQKLATCFAKIKAHQIPDRSEVVGLGGDVVSMLGDLFLRCQLLLARSLGLLDFLRRLLHVLRFVFDIG